MRTDTYYTSAANRFKTTWTYDGLGRVRVRKEYYWYEYYGQWSQNDEVRYIYDGMRVIQERNSGNTPTVSYTRGNDLSGSLEGAGGIGGLLARSHGYSGTTGAWSTHSFYHADGNGNITMLVNSSQSAVATYRYDPYGNTLHSSGTLAGANLQRFSSKLALDVPSMALYYYGERFYAPDLQRWVNRDPLVELGFVTVRRKSPRSFEKVLIGPVALIEEEGNVYRYVHNQPLDRLDPWGLSCYSDCMRERHERIADGVNKCLCIVGVGGAVGATACIVGCLGSGPGYPACVGGCLAVVGTVGGAGLAACVIGAVGAVGGSAAGCAWGCWF